MADDHSKEIARLDTFAKLLDSQFVIPYTKVRIGIDGIIGLVPLYGDLVSFILSIGLVLYIASLGVPLPVMLRICLNTFFDFVIGIVPIFGDIADIFFKSNLRNVALAKRYFEQPARVRTHSIIFLFSISFLTISGMIAFVAAIFWMTLKVLNFLLQAI